VFPSMSKGYIVGKLVSIDINPRIRHEASLDASISHVCILISLQSGPLME
jgi:hypothetical protein